MGLGPGAQIRVGGDPHRCLGFGATGDVELDDQQVLRLTDGLADDVDVAARGDDRIASSQDGFGDVHAHTAPGTGNKPYLLPTRGTFSTSLQRCFGSSFVLSIGHSFSPLSCYASLYDKSPDCL